MTIILQADRNPFDTLIEFVNRVENPGSGERAKVATAITRGFAENFSNEQSGDGRKWEPLAAFTVNERRELGFAGEHPILVRSGRYRASWIQANAPGHVEVFERTGTGWLMDVGSEDERVEELSEGRPGPLFPMPPRPVLPLSAKAEAGLGDVLDFVVDEIAKRV